MMATLRLKAFDGDIARAKDLIGLGQAIGSMTNGIVDAADLYRAALVQSVAAWDRYIHGVVLDVAVDIVFGRRQPALGGKIGLPLSALAAVVTENDPAMQELTARSLIAERLGRETFQRPDDVAAALSMVGITAIWKTTFADPGQVKISLGVIVDRRNKIVHQCDYDPTTPGTVTALGAQDARDAVETIDDIVRQIDKAL
jgi:hypothetical protein